MPHDFDDRDAYRTEVFNNYHRRVGLASETALVEEYLAMQRQIRAHAAKDRSALLRMAGNIAAGAAIGTPMHWETAQAIAETCVEVARRIIATVDGAGK